MTIVIRQTRYFEESDWFRFTIQFNEIQSVLSREPEVVDNVIFLMNVLACKEGGVDTGEIWAIDWEVPDIEGSREIELSA